MSRIPNPTTIETTLAALTRMADAFPADALARLGEIVPEKDCYSIDDFCARNSISRAMYYLLKEEGDTPQETRVGTKVLITKEAAETWRKKPRAGAKQVSPNSRKRG